MTKGKGKGKKKDKDKGKLKHEDAQDGQKNKTVKIESKQGETTLASLLLNEDELQAATKQVQELAYCKWQAAVRSDPLTFWREAELEWIKNSYVPRDESVSQGGV